MKRKLSLQHLSPNWVLILYYGTAILLGALLLSLPLAAQSGHLSFIDALFTATSAQCVTGLVVVDTGHDLSLFGQLVVLLLIQIGGLGITTFSVYLFIYLRQGLGLQNRRLIQETLIHTPFASLKELIRNIFLFTLVIEGIGAALLAIRFVPRDGLVQGLYSAVFHSVSAFCNAGFSLYPDSLVGYRDDLLVNLTSMVLITLGGVGFLVMHELLDLCRRRKRHRLSLHSRLVLMTSLALTLGGAALIWGLEFGSSLRQISFGDGLLTSLFQSVTCRTAGFNSIDLNSFEVPTLLLMMFLMFVGASPGSCGGGIKTTSLALFVAILHSRLHGMMHTNVFRRTVPEELATRTLTLVMLAILLCGASIFILMSFELQGLAFNESRGALLDYAFEAVSAFATVGLSLGVTTKLSLIGKIIIITLMFIGRVGLLTVAFAFIRRARKDGVRYGEERIMIG
ncbi:TrkH family potassium uptake protein [Malonomonas rubra]|uniref:TrkH family potassium uptake protein n=1 Tax=Malonomonas rubra TaxID=57040 RepID=UPI0026EDAA71|nr:TrkH family potassium uptake protein [Malonomonas rubra]